MVRTIGITDTPQLIMDTLVTVITKHPIQHRTRHPIQHPTKHHTKHHTKEGTIPTQATLIEWELPGPIRHTSLE